MQAIWPIAAVLLEVGAVVGVACIILLRRNTTHTAKLAWIVVIVALPLIGIVAYLLVGEVRLGARRRRRHREISALVEETAVRLAARPPVSGFEAIAEPYRALATLAEAVGQHQARAGNDLALITDTELLIQSLVEDIDAAVNHCNLLFYIFLDDHSGQRVADALSRAAKRGVDCRLLIDAVGSKRFARSELRRSVESTGVRIVEALPVNPFRMLFARLDLRNHRKIAVIDGRIGYTGSHNIADAEFAMKPRFAPWVDAMVRAEGPVARDLQLLFIKDWFLDTDESIEELLAVNPAVDGIGMTAQVIGSGPNAFNQALVQMTQSAFHAAHDELILTTPYFVPDEATVTALCTTARRGVRTMLVVPRRNDSPLVAAASRSLYETLLGSGVAIHEYEGGLLHAKTMTVDRSLALIGTANLDRRSFELNFEVSLIVYDTDFASQLRFLQTSYLADSRQIEFHRWQRRPAIVRLWENAAGVLSPLL